MKRGMSLALVLPLIASLVAPAAYASPPNATHGTTASARQAGRVRRMVRAADGIHARTSLTDAERARLTPDQRTAMIRRQGLQRVALRAEFEQEHNTEYTVTIPHESMPAHTIRAQNKSGRCWIFATTNTIESDVYRRTGENVNLSESYVNYHALRTIAEHMMDHTGDHTGASNLADLDEGGFFHWGTNLVDDHGIVPQRAMPDTHDARHSELLITQLRTVVADAQRQLHGLRGPRNAAARAAVRSSHMEQIDALLNASFGTPPTEFRANGKTWTPQTYAAEHLGFHGDDYTTLTHYTGDGYGYNTVTTQASHRGIRGAKSLNVSMSTMEQAVKRSIDEGRAVWFATGVGNENPYIVPGTRDFPRSLHGVMSMRAFDYQHVGSVPEISTRVRQEAHINESNHAMAFVGYQSDAEGNVTKWLVDNSWGGRTNRTDRGQLHMYADFFRSFVTEVGVARELLSPSLRRALEAD